MSAAYKTEQPIAYQHNASALDAFEAAWQDGWRQTRRSLSGLGRREARVLDDLRRLRGCSMLQEGLEIVRAHSKNAADRVALAEALRGYLLAGVGIELTEVEATMRETLANEDGNHAQNRLAYYPSRGARDGVIEAMTGQQVASRLLADVLVTTRPALVQVAGSR